GRLAPAVPAGPAGPHGRGGGPVHRPAHRVRPAAGGQRPPVDRGRRERGDPVTIDFIRLADLPWRDAAVVPASPADGGGGAAGDGPAPGTPRAKVLRTGADGAVTAVVDLPAGG